MKRCGHGLIKVLFQRLHAGTDENKETTVRTADALAETELSMTQTQI
jgi:hypothetical protein